MTQISSALAVAVSLLAFAGVGFVLTNEPAGPGVDQEELDGLRVRLSQLKDRLGSLALEEQARLNRSAEDGEDDVELASPTAESTLLGRLETLETLLLGLEEDPADRAFTYLQSSDSGLRRRGVYNLGFLARSDPDARATLHDMLNDPDAGVRVAALDVIADIGDETAVPIVAGLLDDENAEVRREAISALTRLGTEDAASEIAPFISDENDEVRRLAVDSMGKLGYRGSATALLSALEDPNLGVRGEAISSLGELGATESLPRLRDLYVDQMEGAHKDADHRVQIAMAMKQLGDSTAVQSEIARLGDLIHYRENGGAMRALMWIGRNEPLAAEVFQKASQESQTDWIRREARRMLKGEGKKGR